MGWTKRAIVEDAFGELALAGYDFDLSAEEMEAARRSLDRLMATWTSQGLTLGYAMGAGPDEGDLDDESGLPLVAIDAAVSGLALRLTAGKGKAPAQTLKAAAKAAFDALASRIASGQVQEQQLASGTPRGAGRKPWRTVNQPFWPKPTVDPLQSNSDGGLTFAGTQD